MLSTEGFGSNLLTGKRVMLQKKRIRNVNEYNREATALTKSKFFGLN